MHMPALAAPLPRARSLEAAGACSYILNMLPSMSILAVLRVLHMRDTAHMLVIKQCSATSWACCSMAGVRYGCQSTDRCQAVVPEHGCFDSSQGT